MLKMYKYIHFSYIGRVNNNYKIGCGSSVNYYDMYVMHENNAE